MNIDQRGIDLIVEFEGLRTEAYPDPGTGGEPWTIGIGHTAMAGPPAVKKGDKITQGEAYEIFRHDVRKYEDAVEKSCPTSTQNQFNAMTSLCYNIGPGNFAKSTLVKKHNLRDFPGAAKAFLSWNKAAGKVMKGLTRRREAEKKLYETQSEIA